MEQLLPACDHAGDARCLLRCRACARLPRTTLIPCKEPDGLSQLLRLRAPLGHCVLRRSFETLCAEVTVPAMLAVLVLLSPDAASQSVDLVLACAFGVPVQMCTAAGPPHHIGCGAAWVRVRAAMLRWSLTSGLAIARCMWGCLGVSGSVDAVAASSVRPSRWMR